MASDYLPRESPAFSAKSREMVKNVSRESTRTSQFAEKVDQGHFVEGTGGGASNSRVCDNYRQALSAGDCNVDPVTVEDKGKAAGAVFAVARTEGKNTDWGLLPLKLVHAADAGAAREGSLKGANLRVVGGDEKEVLQCQSPRAAILGGVETSEQLIVDRLDPLNFLVAALDVSVVLDAAENDPALVRDEPACVWRGNYLLLGAVGMRAEASLVNALRDEAAD
jgi:hypothetical protein